MNARNTVPVLLTASLGFLLGMMFTHQTSVKAQSDLQVYVQHTDGGIMGLSPTSIPAREIVGFSCVPDHSFTECYIAYVK
jgi:hypothetical protein